MTIRDIQMDVHNNREVAKFRKATRGSTIHTIPRYFNIHLSSPTKRDVESSVAGRGYSAPRVTCPAELPRSLLFHPLRIYIRDSTCAPAQYRYCFSARSLHAVYDCFAKVFPRRMRARTSVSVSLPPPSFSLSSSLSSSIFLYFSLALSLCLFLSLNKEDTRSGSSKSNLRKTKIA